MTMTGIEKEFGFYPQPVEVDVGDVTIRALVDFDEIVEGVQSSDLVHDGWIYAGLKQSPGLPSRQIREWPFSARVFGLGKTHRFEHGSATGEEHVALKSELGLRPIYHHKPIRADGHLFITVIAYQLRAGDPHAAASGGREQRELDHLTPRRSHETSAIVPLHCGGRRCDDSETVLLISAKRPHP